MDGLCYPLDGMIKVVKLEKKVMDAKSLPMEGLSSPVEVKKNACGRVFLANELSYKAC